MEMMKLGPLGDSYGTNWEEVCSDRISHIFVSFDDRGLTSIQFGYVKNGALVLSTKHGSSNSISTRIVRLNHVSEFVTGISGECFQGVIRSLTFHTNQRTHDAFYVTQNNASFRFGRNTSIREFHSAILDRREFAGFFGSRTCDLGGSSRLRSIGLYIKPILTGTAAPSGFI